MSLPLEKLRAAIEHQLVIRQFGIPSSALAARMIKKDLERLSGGPRNISQVLWHQQKDRALLETRRHG